MMARSARWSLSLFSIGLAAAAACSSSDDPAGPGGGAPTGGGQIPSDQASTPQECQYLGGDGGSDLVSCDYITASFSENVPVTNLGVAVTTDLGDSLALDDADPDALHLELTLDPTETEATGFAIVRYAQQPHYTPTMVSVTVTLDSQTIATTSFTPSYGCVELTGDDWCWMGVPETIAVTLP